ncbi:MAG: hypothetical protein K0S61_574 [Anaerocolumna sp.]|jgi:predicted component of viral defense system (DUF524 family)|nr:hypothetical protein [Anaerocolumna sp.]
MNDLLGVRAIKSQSMIIYRSDLLTDDLSSFKNSADIILIESNIDANTLFIKNNEVIKPSIIYLSEWSIYKVEPINDSIKFQPKDFLKRGNFGNDMFGELQFKNCMGLSFFRALKLFIISAKIDEETFRHMLNVVNSNIINLSFDFNKVTSSSVERDLTIRSDIQYHMLLTLLNWLETKQKSINLFSVFNLIKNNPHRNIFDEYSYEDINNISNTDEEIILDIFSNLDNLSTTNINNNKLANRLKKDEKRYLPQEILQSETVDTFDTNENRFIKYFINYCIEILNYFIKLFIPQRENIINYDLIDLCIKYKKNLESLINDTFLRTVGKLNYLPSNSPTLQRKEGYRQFLNYYVTLKSMPKINIEDKNLSEIIENKNLDVLYEYYCFFVVANILCEIYNTDIKHLSFKTSVGTFSKNLSKKSYSNYFEFVDSNNSLPSVKLLYNKNYKKPESYSKAYDPDIAIEVLDDRNTTTDIVIFDAKFKIKMILAENTEDDINKMYNYDDISTMHTYKDAIDKVLGAYILYPGDNTRIYTQNVYCSNCCTQKCKEKYRGVGAFPLNPRKDDDTSAIRAIIIGMLESCI